MIRNTTICQLFLVLLIGISLSNAIVVKREENVKTPKYVNEEKQNNVKKYENGKKTPMADRNMFKNKETDTLTAQPSFEHHSYESYPASSYDNGGYGGGGKYQGGDHHYAPSYGGGYHHDPLKSLLVPLAGVALLGAAAIFATNPILIQLGVVSGSSAFGKRKRRDTFNQELLLQETNGAEEKLKDVQALESFIDQLPRDEIQIQEKKLLANYIRCSGVDNGKNKCLERLTCEIQDPRANFTDLERRVLGIVTSDIMKNEFLPKELKDGVQEAKRMGDLSGSCKQFYCDHIDI